MQATDLHAGAAGLLAQLLGIGPGQGAATPSGEGEDFIGAFGGQIRRSMLDAGEDPDRLAAMDDAALAAQFLAYAQGQLPLGGSSPAAGSVLAEDIAGPLVGTRSSTAAGPLPTALLQQLTEAMEVGRGLGSSSAARDAAQDDTGLLSRLLSTLESSPGGAGSGLLGSDGLSGFDALLKSVAVGLGAQAPGAVAPGVAGTDRPLAAGPLQAAGGEETFPEGLLDPAEQADRGQDAAPAQINRLEGPRLPPTASDAAGASARPFLLDVAKLLEPGGEARLAERLRWCSQAGLDTAEIKLHPPSLGTLDVRVTLEADKAHVQFITPHPVVKEVLEAAMPRLREALGQEGLSLGDVLVADRAPGDRGDTGGDQSDGSRRQEVDALAPEPAEGAPLGAGTLAALSRRLDYFV